ncbi:putative Ni/Fe-hydrogenase B-type cytochrome subunit [Betaproteobacteria bacterium]|nr:putative Ni/Fe-hydrogenase B-type cytochrome subunit [Betaproteobacteria bacterium]GHU41376.1 putative Ni/Fe-hydrogenase B-type cytochrome subunit [Betaproteobacteria bacterium]
MLSQHDIQEAERHGRQVYSVYVFEAPLRVWHWVNALLMVILAVTGYLIGKPPPTLAGEAADHYVMGYIRFIHFSASYLFAIGLLARLYWAFVGNRHARQIFLLPFTDKEWWKEVIYELRWYLFLEHTPKKYLGHNPMALLMMFFFFTVFAFGMTLTGFGLFVEFRGAGGIGDWLFGWVVPLLGGSQQTHAWHRLGMWLMMSFAVLHIYAAIREEVLSKHSLISTMISGWRMFKD